MRRYLSAKHFFDNIFQLNYDNYITSQFSFLHKKKCSEEKCSLIFEKMLCQNKTLRSCSVRTERSLIPCRTYILKTQEGPAHVWFDSGKWEKGIFNYTFSKGIEVARLINQSACPLQFPGIHPRHSATKKLLKAIYPLQVDSVRFHKINKMCTRPYSISI